MRVLRANLHQLGPKRSKNSTICANEVKASGQEGRAGQVTKSRLHGTAVAKLVDEGEGPVLALRLRNCRSAGRRGRWAGFETREAACFPKASVNRRPPGRKLPRLLCLRGRPWQRSRTSAPPASTRIAGTPAPLGGVSIQVSQKHVRSGDTNTRRWAWQTVLTP